MEAFPRGPAEMPFPPPPPPPGYSVPSVPRRSNGLLKSAGIIEIVEGSLLAVLGLGVFAYGTSGDHSWDGGGTGGWIVLAFAIMAVAVGFILVGAFTVAGRRGAAITLIVLQAIGVLSGLGSISNGGAMTVLLAGATLTLAAFGLHKQSTG